MGITIHYEGRLRSEADLEQVLELARGTAEEAGWPYERVLHEEATLQRVFDDEEYEVRGRVRGIVLAPHPEAEPLAFLFGDDLLVQDFCKTQFAGLQTHLTVVGLLRRIEPHFEQLEVIDEGEYWDSGDEQRLVELLSWFDDAVAAFVAEHPDARVNVRLPDGRIVDVCE